MNIYIKTILHKSQSYPTVGDWKWKNGNLYIYISETKKFNYNFLVALHELCEAMLCKNKNISEKKVTDFDLMFEGERANGLHSIVAECGDDKRAPYRRQHKFATKIEKLMAKELNVDWKKYEQAINMLQ